MKEISLRGNRQGHSRNGDAKHEDGDRTSTTLDVISTDYHFTDDQLEDLFVEGTVPVTAIIR